MKALGRFANENLKDTNNTRDNHDDIPTISSGSAGDRPVLRMQIDLFNHGRKRAVDGGALEPRETDVHSLKEHANAMARETKRDIFNPQKKEDHRLRQHEYKKLLGDREEVEDAVRFSAAALRDAEQKLAALPLVERPHPPLPLMWCLLVGIAGTVMSTIHDFLFSGIEDGVLAWFFSVASAGFLAAAVVWSILGSISATGRRSAANWAGLVAGLIVSAGLGLFRVSGAADSEELLIGIALTVVEVGLTFLADHVAAGLRQQFHDWAARQAVREPAAAAVQASAAEHDRRLGRRQEIDGKITAHIAFVEDLNLRNVNLKELIAQAVKAVLDGYHDGIAFNRGHVLKAGGNQ